MERFDFVSAMDCLIQHISEDLYQNQTDLMDTLFADFVNDSEFEFDNGLVNKWLRGKAKLSPQISLYYRKPKHQYALCTTIEQTILPMMVDPAMAAQELYELLLQDSSVSPQKKEEFDENEDSASLITQLLCFAMSRNFEKWEQPGKYLKAPGGLSPVVRDMVIDNGIPKPCRWFRGREKELEELHNLLVSHDKVFLHGIPGIGKSEVAKAYAQQHRKDYTNILYIPCLDDLKQAIIDVDFVADFPSDTDDQRFKKQAWAKHKEKSIDDLTAKENHCEQELDIALTEFQTLSRRAEAHDPDTFWPERLNLRKTMSQETEDTLRSHFGRSFSQRRLQSAESDVRLYLEDDERSLRYYEDRKRQEERMTNQKHESRRQRKEPER